MNNCSNLNEVRTNIDRIDNEIVKLIGKRSFYVTEAAKFKNNAQEVMAPKRMEEVIKKVRDLAIIYNVDQEMIEKIYTDMITCFISLELREHNKSK